MLLILSFRSQMNKRVSKEVIKFQEIHSPGFILFYLEEEKKYVLLTTNSLLLPTNFDYDTAELKSEIILKPDLQSRLIAKSRDKRDIELYQQVLEKKLEKSRLDVTNDSLQFFNVHTGSGDTDEEPQCAMERSNSLVEMGQNERILEGMTDSINEEKEERRADSFPMIEGFSHDSLLTKMNQNEEILRKTLVVQNKILKELQNLDVDS